MISSPTLQRTGVCLSDVVARRRDGYIQEVESWAVLCQAVQALQDLFLNGDEEEKRMADCSLSGLQLTPRGRISLGAKRPLLAESSTSDTELEKMWIYSLGLSVRGVVSWSEISVGLRTVLTRMLDKNLTVRASLMDLLDVISAYCRGRKKAKPLSHVVMDMYSEAIAQVPGKPSNHDPLMTLSEHKSPEKQMDRFWTRLYLQPTNGAKYFGPNTLIGPEFIVRSNEPTALIHLGDAKASLRKKVLVVLLNGQKIEITCDPSSTTISDLYQTVVGREGLAHPVTMGLACLISGDFVFPPGQTKLTKVAPQPWPKVPFPVYLRFRFYLPSLRGTGSWKWKHVLYLQLRRSLLERQLRAERPQLLALAGLALQAEFGDHATTEKCGGEYFLLEHYLPENETGKKELEALHRHRSGLDPGRAEEMFITHCTTLPEYGSHFMSAHMVSKGGGGGSGTAAVWVGVNAKGMTLTYKREFTGGTVRQPQFNFTWPDIKKISYSKHYFEITTSESKYKLKLDSNKSCYLFHLAWLHHKFFMKLTNEYTPLQTLSEEFREQVIGGSKGVLHVSPDPKRTELGALRRAASLLSPDRALFRAKSAPNNTKSARSESCRETRINSNTSTPLSSHTLASSKSLDTESGSKSSGGRRRPLMGTRAIFSNSQHDLRFSSHSSLELPSPINSDPYIINTNIKSLDNKYHTDFQETISESLAEKFDNAAFVNERILTTVRLERNKEDSLGLHIIEGKDGHAYIISVRKGTPADQSGQIYSGDQIQAVNGVSVLSQPYEEVLRLIRDCPTVELVLSQVDRGQSGSLRHRPLRNSTATEYGEDLLELLQRPIEASYLNAIRYETATEADDTVMAITDLPRPLSYV